MNIAKVAVLFLVFGFIGGTANAGSIRCGTDLIEDDQVAPASRGFVLEKCGPPDDQYGDVLIYKRGHTRFALRFDAEGRLQEIAEEK
jgi:hypothetical protein